MLCKQRLKLINTCWKNIFEINFQMDKFSLLVFVGKKTKQITACFLKCFIGDYFFHHSKILVADRRER